MRPAEAVDVGQLLGVEPDGSDGDQRAAEPSV